MFRAEYHRARSWTAGFNGRFQSAERSNRPSPSYLPRPAPNAATHLVGERRARTWQTAVWGLNIIGAKLLCHDARNCATRGAMPPAPPCPAPSPIAFSHIKLRRSAIRLPGPLTFFTLIIHVVLNSVTPRWLIGHLVRRTFFKFQPGISMPGRTASRIRE